MDNPPQDGGGSHVPTDSIDGAHQSFLPRIGLLTQEEVSKVMWAYLSIQQYHKDIHIMSGPNRPFPHFVQVPARHTNRSEEHTSELQSLMRISYAVFCLKKKMPPRTETTITQINYILSYDIY